MDSVNLTTTKQAPAEYMIQLGPWFKRLIANLVDNYYPNLPLRLLKIGIKDVFWHPQVNKQYSRNFGYVLPYFVPTKEMNNINLFVLNWLQMG